MAVGAMGRGLPRRQDQLVEELFRNYFLESKTICDKQVLLAAAEKASPRPSPLGVRELRFGRGT